MKITYVLTCADGFVLSDAPPPKLNGQKVIAQWPGDFDDGPRPLLDLLGRAYRGDTTDLRELIRSLP